MAEISQKNKGRALLRGTLALMAGSGLGAALSLLLTILLANFLSATDFTAYTTMLAYLFPAMLLAEFGMATLLLRELSVHPDHTRSLMIHLLPLRLGICAVVACGFVLVMLLIAPQQSIISLLLATPLIFIYSLFAMLSAILRSRMHMGWVATLNVGMLVVQVVILLVIGQNLTGVNALLINTLTSLGQLAAAISIVTAMTRHDAMRHIDFSNRAWLRQSVPFAIASALGALQARLLIILIDQQFPPLQTAQFIVASRFVDAARLLLMAFFDALYPRLSAQADDSTALSHTRRLLFGVSILYAFSMMGLLQVSTLLIPLLFAPVYHAASDILPVLAIAFIPMTLHAACNLYCYATRLENVANIGTVITITAMVAVAMLAIPQTVNDFLGAIIVIESGVTVGIMAVLKHLHWQRASTRFQYTPGG